MFHPVPQLGFKALVGRAFRAPAPSELFGANTWSLASNLAGSTANLSTNSYSPTTAGVDLELQFDLHRAAAGRFSGFANASWVKLIRENIEDPNITESRVLVWAPRVFGKAGVLYRRGAWEASLGGRFQGPVRRRLSDRANPTYAPLRPDATPAWASLDATVSYAVHPGCGLAFRART